MSRPYDMQGKKCTVTDLAESRPKSRGVGKEGASSTTTIPSVPVSDGCVSVSSSVTSDITSMYR